MSVLTIQLFVENALSPSLPHSLTHSLTHSLLSSLLPLSLPHPLPMIYLLIFYTNIQKFPTGQAKNTEIKRLHALRKAKRKEEMATRAKINDFKISTSELKKLTKTITDETKTGSEVR